MNYYAIQVKSGSEVTVAKKLDSLNRKSNGELFSKVVVPFSIKTTINSNKRQASQCRNLLFNSYVFIQLETITPKIYSVLREVCTSVFRIITEPISESEMSFLDDSEVTEFIVEVPENSSFIKMQELFKKIILLKKNQVHITIKESRYLHLNIPTNMAKTIINKHMLKMSDLLRRPLILIEGLLNYQLYPQP